MRQIVMDGPRKSHVAMSLTDRHRRPNPGEADLHRHVPFRVVPVVDSQKGRRVRARDRWRRRPDGRPCRRASPLASGSRAWAVVATRSTSSWTRPRRLHVPDNLKDEDALAEPLACLLSAATKMPPVIPGDRIAVVGTGYMGLGMVSLFKTMGYGDIVAVDPREEARANALKFGATEAYHPSHLPKGYKLDWPTIGRPDLTRDGHAADIFNIGFQNVLEFAGTESALQLAGDMVCAHGRLGIGGYHNDGPRTIDYGLWNFKALTAVNCHERRIMWEVDLSRRCLRMLSQGPGSSPGSPTTSTTWTSSTRPTRTWRSTPTALSRASSGAEEPAEEPRKRKAQVLWGREGVFVGSRKPLLAAGPHPGERAGPRPPELTTGP